MSDTTPKDDKTNPETDASVTTPKQPEPDAFAYDSPAGNRDDSSDAGTEADRYTGTGSHSALTPEPVPDPVAAGVDKRETYLPAATVDDTDTTIRSDESVAREQYPEYNPAQPVAPTPIYVQAPTPPRKKGNRGFGVLVALLATIIYAALYALAVFIIANLDSGDVASATRTFSEFVVLPVFYVPVIVFFLALALLIALVNRGGWWAYVLVGFFVAVAVYFSYIGGALLTAEAWTLTRDEFWRFLSSLWLNPGAIAAAVIAREVPIWAGAWIAHRGRRVTARNIGARHEYDRKVAEGPQLTHPA